VKGEEFDSSMPKDEKSWFHLQTAAELFMWANTEHMHSFRFYILYVFHLE
jgi:hypothetical protein